MLYLANPTSSRRVRDAMTAGHLGLIVTPRQGNDVTALHAADVLWCADNGCYGKGYPGDDAWHAWLGTLPRAGCLFATAPDVVGDAAATLARSVPWLARIRALGFPAALVAQDGLEELDVPWDAFDVLFIGGTTPWKLGPHAARLTAEARTRGKHVHMGRVNSRRRYLYALHIGCHSVDGTYLVYGPDTNLPGLLAWTSTLDFGGAA